jgi:hypothetical protein
MQINGNSHRIFIMRILFEACSDRHWKASLQMFDFVLLALGLGFFAVSIGYAVACDHL